MTLQALARVGAQPGPRGSAGDVSVVSEVVSRAGYGRAARVGSLGVLRDSHKDVLKGPGGDALDTSVPGPMPMPQYSGKDAGVGSGAGFSGGVSVGSAIGPPLAAWQDLSRSSSRAVAASEHLWQCPSAELLDILRLAEVAQAQLDAARLAVVGELDTRGVGGVVKGGSGRASAVVSTSSVLAAEVGVDPKTCSVWVRAARRLGWAAGRIGTAAPGSSPEQLSVTRQALTAGRLSLAHAEVISGMLSALPSSTAADDVRWAEDFLVDQATRVAPGMLRRLAARIAHHLDPDGVLGRERSVARTARVWVASDRGSGVRFGGCVDSVTGAQLATFLDSHSAPAAQVDPVTGQLGPDSRCAEQRRAEAFGLMVRTAVTADEARSGGVGAELIVTIPLATLRAELTATTAAGPLLRSVSGNSNLAWQAAISQTGVPGALGQAGDADPGVDEVGARGAGSGEATSRGGDFGDGDSREATSDGAGARGAGSCGADSGKATSRGGDSGDGDSREATSDGAGAREATCDEVGSREVTSREATSGGAGSRSAGSREVTTPVANVVPDNAGLPGAADQRAPEIPQIATLETGSTLSAARARELACDARIVPLILGSRGEPLDIGRATRVVPAGLRRALIYRDRGCAFPGCGRPPRWAHAHHIHHWSRGGPTAIDNLVLLCPAHHDIIHHTNWAVRILNGKPKFTPPGVNEE